MSEKSENICPFCLNPIIVDVEMKNLIKKRLRIKCVLDVTYLAVASLVGLSIGYNMASTVLKSAKSAKF